jgi:hypothetical protein
LPNAGRLSADKVYRAIIRHRSEKDGKGRRVPKTMQDKGIRPFIPGRSSHAKPVKHHKLRYKRRHRIGDMFGRLTDRRRVTKRYDRCLKAFLSAIALAKPSSSGNAF